MTVASSECHSSTAAKKLKMNISVLLLLCIGTTVINQVSSILVILTSNHQLFKPYFQVVMVEADYLVSIRIHNYSNPTNQCATCSAERNHCCDTQRTSGVCDECNTYFRYCIQSFDGIGDCIESHQYVQPGILLDFSKEFLLLRHNPMLFRGPTKAWDVSYSDTNSQCSH